MSDQPVIIETKDRICILKLNEPDRLNAMSDEMSVEFKKTIEALKEDKNPKVLIITGAGRAFSAGGNLDKIAASFGTDPGIRKKNII